MIDVLSLNDEIPLFDIIPIVEKRWLFHAHIYNSLLLKTHIQRVSLIKEIEKMNKEAILVYKASQDGFSQEVFWQNCVDYKETIVLVKTDKDSVIGGYCPDQWEDTTGMKRSNDWPGYKDIVSRKPFLFYWINDQIQIIKHYYTKIPFMGSNKDCLMLFGYGLWISTDQNKDS